MPQHTSAQTTPAAGALQAPHFARVEIKSRDLRSARDFYQGVLGLACDLNGDRLDVGGFMTVEEESCYYAQSSAFVLTLTVENLAEVTSHLSDPRVVPSSSEHTARAVWCTDPDGHRIQILELTSRRPDRREHRAAEKQTVRPDKPPGLSFTDAVQCTSCGTKLMLPCLVSR
jgi:catechol-2,3-dioxygenase